MFLYFLLFHFEIVSTKYIDYGSGAITNRSQILVKHEILGNDKYDSLILLYLSLMTVIHAISRYKIILRRFTRNY